MRLLGCQRPAACALLALAATRRRPAVMSIFPDVDTPSDDRSELQGPNPPAVIGFWTMYDDVAMEDALGKVTRGEPSPSLLATNMVLRADGQTSRGSDFTKGSWTIEKQERKRRLRMTLKSRVLQEELRYDGLLLKIDASQVPSGDITDPDPEQEPRPRDELRVVGRCSRWKVSGGEEQLLKESSFSMIKLVERKELTPTIRPVSQPLDPEEAQREFDATDAAELRSLLDEVRRAKKDNPDSWQEQFKPEAVADTESDGGTDGEGESPPDYSM